MDFREKVKQLGMHRRMHIWLVHLRQSVGLSGMTDSFTVKLAIKPADAGETGKTGARKLAANICIIHEC